MEPKANPGASAVGRFAQKLRRKTTEPIAIVGLACRFPGASNIDAYRRLLADGRHGIIEVPRERWDLDAYYAPESGTPGKMSTRYGGFCADIDKFDAPLFRIPPREAEAMDPQHRVVLEVAWETLESAGVPLEAISGTQTAVFVGVSAFDYLHFLDYAAVDGYTNTGLAHSTLAGRLSFFFNLKGPCEVIDTACSGSLVAVHRACQSLRTGEVDFALAGGVNAILSPHGHVGFSQAGMMAPDGRCKTFDAAANGYVRGEGCGLVLLKRLSDAQRDGDVIHAVISGSAVNHDGRSQGLTAPNGVAQRDLLVRSLGAGGVSIDELDVVEAHGTGTRLGAPQELGALAEVARGRDASRRIVVSSAKTNVGHLEAAAGIAGLLRMVLMVRGGEVFPHLNLSTVHPEIPLETFPLQVPVERRPWPAHGDRRVGAVSSFGFSGTNASVIVESAPTSEVVARAPERAAELLVLSARTAGSLTELARRWSRHLAEDTSTSLLDLAFTASTGRTHLEQRAAIVMGDRASAREALAALVAGREHPRLARGHVKGAPPRIAFLFTGQGAQHEGMGKKLYATEPVFRASLDELAALVASELPRPLLDVMFAGGAEIHQTMYAQPALVALELSLARLWESWGIRPWGVLGHSVGEITAACVAGVMSAEDAMRLAATRGRLMQALPAGGAMLAVRASPADVADVIAKWSTQVSLSAVNGPTSTVISGAGEAIAAIDRELTARNLKTRALEVSHAFHSQLLDPMLAEFEARAATIAYAPAKCTWISNVTGRAVTSVDAAYWRTHAREAVQFEAGMRSLASGGANVFVEIGPSPVLCTMARSFIDDATWVSTLEQPHDDARRVLDAVGAMYVRGAPIDWRAVYDGRGGRKAALPSYPFERKRYWMATSSTRAPSRGARSPNADALLGDRVPSAASTVQFESWLAADQPGYLGGHRIYGLPVFPATGYIAQVLAAARVLWGNGEPVPCELESIVLERALVLDDEPRRVQVLLTPQGEGGDVFRFEVHSSNDGETWLRHAHGVVTRAVHAWPPSPALPDVATASDEDLIAPDVHYRGLADRGMLYAGAFRSVRELRRGQHGSGTSLARVAVDDRAAVPPIVHPALLDGCLQSMAAAVATKLSVGGAFRLAYLPVKIERVRFRHPPGASATCSVTVVFDASGFDYAANVTVFDSTGAAAIELEGVRMFGVERANLSAGFGESDSGILQRVLAADTGQRRELLSGFLRDLVGQITGVDGATLEASTMYFELGMSSLGSVELQYRIQKNLGCKLPNNMIVDYESTESLADRLLEMIGSGMEAS